MDPQANPFAVLSLIAAPVAEVGKGTMGRAIEAIAVTGGILAVSALIHGSILLVRETRLVVQVLHERAQSVRARAASADRLSR